NLPAFDQKRRLNRLTCAPYLPLNRLSRLHHAERTIPADRDYIQSYHTNALPFRSLAMATNFLRRPLAGTKLSLYRISFGKPMTALNIDPLLVACQVVPLVLRDTNHYKHIPASPISLGYQACSALVHFRIFPR